MDITSSTTYFSPEEVQRQLICVFLFFMHCVAGILLWMSARNESYSALIKGYDVIATVIGFFVLCFKETARAFNLFRRAYNWWIRGFFGIFMFVFSAFMARHNTNTEEALMMQLGFVLSFVIHLLTVNPVTDLGLINFALSIPISTCFFLKNICWYSVFLFVLCALILMLNEYLMSEASEIVKLRLLENYARREVLDDYMTRYKRQKAANDDLKLMIQGYLAEIAELKTHKARLSTSLIEMGRSMAEDQDTNTGLAEDTNTGLAEDTITEEQ